MIAYTLLLVILGLMILFYVVAERYKISPPIFLIIGGIALGFLPGMPSLTLDSEIIFLLFLPPLLFDAAFNISAMRLRANWATISSLAFSLVFVTTVGIACVAKLIISGMSWPVAFVLGSILAATDAVAAMGITKDMGISSTTATVLEGESLINDASALVAYRFAVAAVSGTAFIIWKAWITFVLLIGGGVGIGLGVGYALSYLVRFSRHNSMAVHSFILLAPFVTYLVAEHFHCSGVIAVVCLGLWMSRLSRLKFPEGLKKQSHTIWGIIVFILNGFIFVLIGLTLPAVIRSSTAGTLLLECGYALLITLVMFIIRMVNVFWKRNSILMERHKAALKPGVRRRSAVLLSVEDCLVVSLSGMRGIVSLAIAIALPVTIAGGEAFPHRNTLIFISTVVVIITIVGQGLLLPPLLRRLKKRHV
jgi:Na+/H+ antiporter